MAWLKFEQVYSDHGPSLVHCRLRDVYGTDHDFLVHRSALWKGMATPPGVYNISTFHHVTTDTYVELTVADYISTNTGIQRLRMPLASTRYPFFLQKATHKGVESPG